MLIACSPSRDQHAPVVKTILATDILPDRHSARSRLRSSPRIGAIQRLHRVLPAAHGMSVVTQRHDGVLVPGKLGDEANLDALRLKRRDEAVAGAVRSHRRQAQSLQRRRPEALAEVAVDQRATAPDPW